MIGTTISHYKILDKLGGGGMGVVYQAEDLVLGRKVALKVLPDTLAEEPEALARFQREARAASALNHPHICTIYELAEEQGRSFIVMELMDGRTLKYRIGGQPMPAEQIVRIGAQVADALEAAHQAGIVHRDLKPANLFVTRHGEAKVLDFGLAKITEHRPQRESATPASIADAETELASEHLTTAGAAMGTVAYMSPEQVRGEEIDVRTDLFSLGVVLYEMATGKQPFAGDTAGVIFNKILTAAPTSPVRINPDLPDELEHIINKALEKDKALRYQSASEFKADLLRLERDTTAAPLTAEVPRKPSRRGAWIGLAATTAAVVLAASLWLGRNEPAALSPATPAPAQASVAVLPFVDLSPEKDQEYFTDGLTEELSSVLAKIRELKVAGRTSSFQFKDRAEDLRVVGEKLGVASVLEGSVRKAGDRIRITAQLVNAADGFHLWSETYDRTLEDIFAVQDDIAASVAEALKVTLVGNPGDSYTTGIENVEVYNLYLQGQHFRKRLSRENLERAAEYFEQALALDTDYAPAWAGLARTRTSQAGAAWLPLDEAYRQAREAATRAIELDGNLAEGWSALGIIKTYHDWDWAGAEMAFAKARNLAPGDAGVVSSASSLSSTFGRLDEAIAFARRAVELDPLDAKAHARLGITLMNAVGHEDEAEATIQKLLELQPGRGFAHTILCRVELSRSRPEAALAAITKESASHWRRYGLALAYHALGRTEDADAALMELTEVHAHNMQMQLAETQAFRGEPDAAFEWLERAYTHRDPGLAEVKASALLANLHDDPRWPVFLRKMGLPE